MYDKNKSPVNAFFKEISKKYLDKGNKMYYIISMRKEKIFSLRLTSGMRDALGKAARRDRRSIASLLEKVISDYLAKEGIKWEEAVSYLDRRQYPRTNVSLPARLTIQQTPEIFEETEALIENMSLGGSYVTYTNGHRSPWKLQSSIHLVVRIPGAAAPLELVGRAVRVLRDDQKVGVGLQHMGTPKETLVLIDRFLQADSPESFTPSDLPLQ